MLLWKRVNLIVLGIGIIGYVTCSVVSIGERSSCKFVMRLRLMMTSDKLVSSGVIALDSKIVYETSRTI